MEIIYDEKLSEYWFNDLGMCGCGRPEEVLSFIFKMIKIRKEYNDKAAELNYDFNKTKDHYAQMNDNLKDHIKNTDPDLIFEFVYHALEKAGFISHGYSVYSSSLTEKGVDFFERLKKEITE